MADLLIQLAKIIPKSLNTLGNTDLQLTFQIRRSGGDNDVNGTVQVCWPANNGFVVFTDSSGQELNCLSLTVKFTSNWSNVLQTVKVKVKKLPSELTSIKLTTATIGGNNDSGEVGWVYLTLKP